MVPYDIINVNLSDSQLKLKSATNNATGAT